MANGNGGTAAQGNGGDPQQAQGQAGTAPQLNVLAQYVKDFSFENPNAPRSLTPGTQPQINIQVSVNAAAIQQNDYEVTLKVDGKAESSGSVIFNFELVYAGVFRIQNVPQDSLHPVMMIECPRLLFPFAREIIASTVSSGGFPPLLLDPVDFVGLYRQNLERSQQQNPAPTAQT
ncbi:MAG: protein-export chaperone SecB [Pseudolabrys sp.]|nr:protein-export chaperone SecB [Pseudolabrys sp.]MBV9955159.1 protein-export chaperone SecB [Pseudolabrys sp.]